VSSSTDHGSGRLPFDHVTVQEGQTTRRLSVAEFLRTPLQDRVTWILERRLAFLRGDRPIDTKQALLAMRAAESRVK
jgi:hypothetical protein